MGVSEARRLKELEAENRKLKQLLADAHLDNAALKELLGKTGEARGEERGCQSPGGSGTVQPAAGRTNCGDPSIRGTVSFQTPPG